MLTYSDGQAFAGTVGRELADSVQAYPDVVRPKPGTPNVVLVVLDDVGYAQIGCFGSDIETPAFDRLAENGLRYRSFHTTAMCSPTRACLLTGRNQHTTGMGGIADNATGFPGFNGRIGKDTGFLSEVLRDEGFATMAVGKWHLAPREESDLAALASVGRSVAGSSVSTDSSEPRPTSTRLIWCTTTTSSSHQRRKLRAITSPKTSPIV
jgi:arylsulfatase A-like enzyme